MVFRGEAHSARGKGQDVNVRYKSKRQSARGKVQEAKCKRQSARGKVQEAKCQRQSARGKVPEAKCKRQNARGKVQEAKCKRQSSSSPQYPEYDILCFLGLLRYIGSID